jgi:hypothetical protein
VSPPSVVKSSRETNELPSLSPSFFLQGGE